MKNLSMPKDGPSVGARSMSPMQRPDHKMMANQAKPGQVADAMSRMFSKNKMSAKSPGPSKRAKRQLITPVITSMEEQEMQALESQYLRDRGEFDKRSIFANTREQLSLEKSVSGFFHSRHHTLIDFSVQHRSMTERMHRLHLRKQHIEEARKGERKKPRRKSAPEFRRQTTFDTNLKVHDNGAHTPYNYDWKQSESRRDIQQGKSRPITAPSGKKVQRHCKDTTEVQIVPLYSSPVSQSSRKTGFGVNRNQRTSVGENVTNSGDFNNQWASHLKKEEQEQFSKHHPPPIPDSHLNQKVILFYRQMKAWRKIDFRDTF